MGWGGWSKIRSGVQRTASNPRSIVSLGVSSLSGGMVPLQAAAGGLQDGGFKGGISAADGAVFNKDGWWSDMSNVRNTALAPSVGVITARNLMRPEDSNPEIPPDLQDMYKNDPEQAKQFTRLRKAASMLGRAGTIKAKGSTSLGSDQPLGTNLALTGA